MKFAVISDIHGNLPALDAVLDDLRRRGIDAIVNLGDLVSGPLFPAETADRLMRLGLPTIRGNHERQLLTRRPDGMGASDRFAAERLDAQQWRWLESLPVTLRLRDDVLLVHGTPDDDLGYLLETVEEAGARFATADEIAGRAGDASFRLLLCGHTHLPRVVRMRDGRLIVNPGSVGLPAFAVERPFPHRMQTGSPHARYAVLEEAEGAWSVQLLAIPYDWSLSADAAEQSGRADWAGALRSGFA